MQTFMDYLQNKKLIVNNALKSDYKQWFKKFYEDMDKIELDLMEIQCSLLVRQLMQTPEFKHVPKNKMAQAVLTLLY